MRTVRILAILAATLLVGLALAAWLVPPRLDWNFYRGDLANFASARLGRSVRLDGPIALRLLPQPQLVATGVSVDGDAASGVSLTAREMRLRMSLREVISGRLGSPNLVLRGVELKLADVGAALSLNRGAPAWLAHLSAEIEDGQVSIGALTLTDVQASVATDSLTGTNTASGHARAMGQDWRFAVRLTRPGGDRSAGLDISLNGEGPAHGAAATVTGQLSGDGNLAGRIAAHGPDLSVLIPAPAMPFRADGRLTIADGLAVADDLAISLADTPAHGAISLRLSPRPRLDIALAAAHIALDPWLALTLPTQIALLPIGIDLSAEAASLAAGEVRRLRAAVDIADGSVTVREASAILPGEAELHLSGRIDRPTGGPPSFDGDATLSAPAARATIAWLGRATATPIDPPAAALRSADIAGHLRVGAHMLALHAVSGTVDGSRVAGNLALELSADGTPSVSATLDVDRLDADAWTGADAAGRVDADLRITARQAVWRGFQAAPLLLDGTLIKGRVSLRKLDGQIGGVHAMMSGVVSPDGQIADGAIELHADHATDLASLLPDPARGLADRSPGFWRAPADMTVQVSGPPHALALRLAGSVGDLHMDAQPLLDWPAHSWSGPVAMRHPGAPRLAEALGASGVTSWLGDGSLSLVGTVSAHWSDGPQDPPPRVAVTQFVASAGALRASGDLLLARGNQPVLTGNIVAETLPLPLPYPRSPSPIMLGALAGWTGSVKLRAAHVLVGASPLADTVAALVTLRDGTLRLEAMTGRVGGGALAGAASLDSASRPPSVALTASLTGATVSGPLFDLPLDVTGGTLDAHAALRAEGYSPLAFLSTVSGAADMTVRHGMLAGVALAGLDPDLEDNELKDLLAAGQTEFDSAAVRLTLASGLVSVTAGTLLEGLSVGSLTGDVDLAAWTANLHLGWRPARPDPPEIGLRLEGKLDAPRRIPELAGVSAWRASHPGL